MRIFESAYRHGITDGDLVIHAQALRPVFRTYLSGDQP